MAPEPGTVYQSCEKIYVNLVARDPERQLDHTIFTVDGQVIGLPLQGWLSPLPAGDHILTLEAFDQQGLSASDSVTITVKSDLDCDGMTDEYEAAYGMQEDNPYDAAFDPDQDGLINFDEAWYGTYPNDPDSDDDGFSDGFEVRMRSNPMDPLSKPIQLLYLPLILR
jgi:hypothetical protein